MWLGKPWLDIKGNIFFYNYIVKNYEDTLFSFGLILGTEKEILFQQEQDLQELFLHFLEYSMFISSTILNSGLLTVLDLWTAAQKRIW